MFCASSGRCPSLWLFATESAVRRRYTALHVFSRIFHRSLPDPLVGPEDFRNLPGLVGSGQEVFEISWVGSGRVGSGRVGSGRVGSGRVGSGRVGSGRVGSVRSGRVRSGRVGPPRCNPVQPGATRPSTSDPIREKLCFFCGECWLVPAWGCWRFRRNWFALHRFRVCAPAGEHALGTRPAHLSSTSVACVLTTPQWTPRKRGRGRQVIYAAGWEWREGGGWGEEGEGNGGYYAVSRFLRFGVSFFAYNIRVLIVLEERRSSWQCLWVCVVSPRTNSN